MITVMARNEFGAATAVLRLLPTTDYSCTVAVSRADHSFVPGDHVPLNGSAQLTPVGSALQAGSNVTLTVGGAAGWQSSIVTLDAAGAFAASYDVPPWLSAVGMYQVYCRHPLYGGEERKRGWMMHMQLHRLPVPAGVHLAVPGLWIEQSPRPINRPTLLPTLTCRLCVPARQFPGDTHPGADHRVALALIVLGNRHPGHSSRQPAVRPHRPPHQPV